MFKMFFGIYMIMVFDPQILFNDGFYDLIERVRIPEGSLFEAALPRCICRAAPMPWAAYFDILGGLLGQKTAGISSTPPGSLSSPHLFYSGWDSREDGTRDWFQLFQIGFGGIPGRPLGDGPDGHSLWPGFHQCPQRVSRTLLPAADRTLRHRARQRRGGACTGAGNGIHMTYRFLADGEIAIHDDRWFVPPWGVNGGHPGAAERRRCWNAPTGRRKSSQQGGKRGGEAGDLLHFITWGGGGWGDPLARDSGTWGLEIRQGLVTPEGASPPMAWVADSEGLVGHRRHRCVARGNHRITRRTAAVRLRPRQSTRCAAIAKPENRPACPDPAGLGLAEGGGMNARPIRPPITAPWPA